MALVIFLTACPTMYYLYKYVQKKDEENYARVKVRVKDSE